MKILSSAIVVMSVLSAAMPAFAATAQDHFTQGRALIGQAKWTEAADQFSQAVKIDPKYSEAYYWLGFSYGNLDKYDQAISNFSKAIKNNPNFAEAYNNRGFLYLKKEKLSDAIKDFTKALQIKPNNEIYFLNRGLAYEKKSDDAQAMIDFSQSIAIKPRMESHASRGALYARRGDVNNALLDLNRAIELAPLEGSVRKAHLAQAYANRIGVNMSLKQYDAVRSDIEQVKAIGYQVNPDVLEQLARVDKEK